MAEPAPTPAPAPAPTPAAAPAAAAPAQPVTPISAAATPAPAAAEPGKGFWPEGWQAQIAGENKDEMTQLSRYASPKAIWEKARSLEKKFSSGELVSRLPKDPKPEELALWRKDQGIPEAPDKYDLTGITLPPEDKDIVAGFLKAAHEVHMTPAQARAALSNYYAMHQSQLSAQQARDTEHVSKAQDALNAEWGPQYRRNLNLIEGTVLAKFPESVRELIKGARLPDGSALFNNVDAMRGMAALALEINPAAIVAPAGGADLGKTAVEEYTELQKFMREKRGEYNKDAAKQERVRNLIDYLGKNGLIDAQGNVISQQKKAA